MLISVTFTGALPSLTGCRQARGVQRVAADVLLPPSEEVQLGRRVSVEVEQQFQIHPDTALQSYVAQLGHLVVQTADNVPRDITFTFKVIDDPDMINAFALPGGWIYVFSGLLRAMDNEAELVAVLAHEVAHVTRRHLAQRLVAAYGLEVITRTALGEDPGMLQSLVAAVAQQGFMLSYSRDQEREADAYGLRYMVNANYDPRAFISFFQKINGDRPSPPTFLLSHPLPRERIENIQLLISEIDRPPQRREEQRFQDMKQRI